MPPKGAKKGHLKRKADPTSVAKVGVTKKTGDSNIKVQLVEGEQDSQNLDFHSKLQAA